MSAKFSVDYELINNVWKFFVVLGEPSRPGNVDMALGGRTFTSCAEARAYLQGLEDRDTDQFKASMVTFSPKKA